MNQLIDRILFIGKGEIDKKNRMIINVTKGKNKSTDEKKKTEMMFLNLFMFIFKMPSYQNIISKDKNMLVKKCPFNKLLAAGIFRFSLKMKYY